MRRWHPDKFLQKLGHRVSEVEKEEVEFEHLRLESVLSFSIDAQMIQSLKVF